MSTKRNASRVRETYRFIEAHKNKVEVMCRVLGVARNGYYEWLREHVSKRGQEQVRLLRLIRAPPSARMSLRSLPNSAAAVSTESWELESFPLLPKLAKSAHPPAQLLTLRVRDRMPSDRVRLGSHRFAEPTCRASGSQTEANASRFGKMDRRLTWADSRKATRSNPNACSKGRCAGRPGCHTGEG